MKNSSGRYACLSHCWGEFQPLKTTNATLEHHKVSIAWETIPQTFQDAIKVTKSLGLDYIWIDSLCIVQDDKADWIRESKEMCGIYENSHFTIAATSAPDSSGGLFLKDRVRHEVRGTTSAGMNFQFILHKTDEMNHPAVLARPWVNTIIHERWPLLERAWVFQERMLSPRVLHFVRNEIIWECRQQTWCTCEKDFNINPRNEKKKYFEHLNQPTKANLVKLWHELVETYFPLNLTMPSDRFPALSGLATQMGKMRPQATYLAGLWSDSLERDLLWHVRTTAPPKPSSIIFQAPSWSWASSTHDQVFHFLDDEELLHSFFTVSEARTTLATDNPTGEVQGGSVMITAPTFEVNLVHTLPDEQEAFDGIYATPSDSIMRISSQSLRRNFLGTDEISFDALFPRSLHSYEPIKSPEHIGHSLMAGAQPGGSVGAKERVMPAGDLSALYGRIKCIRMARTRSIDDRMTHYRELDISMAVEQLPSSTYFKRVGIALSQRSFTDFEEQRRDPERIWRENPSLWEDGGVMETITIV